MRLSFLGASLAALACAQTLEQKNMYPKWHVLMGLYGYEWEPIELHTNDGYTITMMHVTGKIGEETPTERPLGPLLFQHPMGSDPENWLAFYAFDDPSKNALPLRLFDDGFDVYFPFNRGMSYSTKHDTYPYESFDFWNFTWYDVAMNDNIAEIDYIFDKTGQKVKFLGFSQGTTQAFVLMASAYDEMKDKMSNIAMQSPCTISEAQGETLMGSTFLLFLHALKFYAIGGPDWYKIVPELSRVIGRKTTNLLTIGWGRILKDVPLKILVHYSQNWQSQRFQMWSDDYWNKISPETKTELIDLSINKTIPVGMWMGSADVSCPNHYNEDNRQLLGDMVKVFHIYDGKAHGDIGEMNDDDFYNETFTFLSTNFDETETPFLQ